MLKFWLPSYLIKLLEIGSFSFLTLLLKLFNGLTLWYEIFWLPFKLTFLFQSFEVTKESLTSLLKYRSLSKKFLYLKLTELGNILFHPPDRDFSSSTYFSTNLSMLLVWLVCLPSLFMKWCVSYLVWLFSLNLYSKEDTPIIVNRSAIIFPFTFKSKGLSVFIDGDRFTSINHGFKF
jgi:hypothetical protein